MDEARQVLGMLRGRGVLQGWDVRLLDRLSDDQVAGEFRSTTIFLSLAYQEGFGLSDGGGEIHRGGVLA